MTTELSTLPSLRCQADRLVQSGVPELAGVSAEEIYAFVAEHDGYDGLLALHPRLAPPSVLAPLMRREGKPGFVVSDMTDVDDFVPIPAAVPPEARVYAVAGVDRGDEMSNWSPTEALEAIVGRRRTPLLLSEGISWVLQQPDALERNKCFMTIGSRLVKPTGTLDSRTPAVWISNGTGRDGRENRDAPKVGWCWANNRHTWLGFASAERRLS